MGLHLLERFCLILQTSVCYSNNDPPPFPWWLFLGLFPVVPLRLFFADPIMIAKENASEKEIANEKSKNAPIIFSCPSLARAANRD
jgi:hypothetical protein